MSYRWMLFLILILKANCCDTQQLGAINYVQNGDFELPVISGNLAVMTPGNVIGWTSTQSEMGKGHFYNSRWTSQVLELTANQNVAYSQIVTAVSGHLKFKIQCAARTSSPFSIMGFQILWNGNVILDVNPATDYEIHDYSFDLQLNGTTGNITLLGTSQDQRDGITCDNVEIRQVQENYFRQKINGVCPCLEGYYDTYLGSVCLACSDWDTHCLICSKQILNDATSDVKCTKCQEGFYITDDGTCTECKNSISGCLKCSQSGSTCSQCSSSNGFSLNATDFKCFCLANQFSLIMSCEPCTDIHPKCELCSSIAQVGICETCALGYFLSNNFCFICSVLDKNCLFCTQDGSKCTVCSDGFFPSGHLCLPCSNALQGCLNCSMNALECYSCDLEENFLLQQHSPFCRRTLECLEESAFSSSLFISPSVPKLNYSNQECKSALAFQKMAQITSITSYVVLFFSIVSAKIVGVELFGVLQIAFFNLAGHSPVNLFLSPLFSWRTMSGFNLPIHSSIFFSNQINSAPPNFKAIEYSHSFLQNVNIMLVALIGQIVISLILTVLSRFIPILRIVSEFFSKQLFVTLLMFNCFNISFSAGVHFRYATEQNTQKYHLSTAIAILSLLLCFFGGIAMEFVDSKGYGQFKHKMKKNFITRLYIPLSIFYRLVLGFWMGFATNHHNQSLLSISIILTFLLYSVVNLPFLETYQNYRSIMCHSLHLLIFVINNYYKGLPENERNKKFLPAQIQLCLLVVCLIMSTVCLIFEIYLYLRKTLMRRNKVFDEKGEKKQKENFNQESRQNVHHYSEHSFQ